MSNPRSPPPDRRAFTVVEAFVILGIVMVLLGMIAPWILGVIEASNRLGCSSNMRQIGMAFALYQRDRSHYPMGGGDCFSPAAIVGEDDIYTSALQPMPRIPSYYTPGVGAEGSLAPNGVPAVHTRFQDWGWAYQILPYIGHDNLWRLAQDQDAHIRATAIPLYVCPSNRSPQSVTPPFEAGIDYAGNGGTFGINNPNPQPPLPLRRLQTWHIKEDFPNFQSSGRIYRNGAMVKNRFWPRAPHPAWDHPVYVDEPLRPPDFRDGLSTTLLVVENPGGGGWTHGYADTNVFASSWRMPDSQIHDCLLEPQNRPTHSAHPYGANALFMDGSVRRLSYSMSIAAQAVPVWNPMVDQAPANPPMMELSLYQRLCHRFDGSHIQDAQLE